MNEELDKFNPQVEKKKTLDDALKTTYDSYKDYGIEDTQIEIIDTMEFLKKNRITKNVVELLTVEELLKFFAYNLFVSASLSPDSWNEKQLMLLQENVLLETDEYKNLISLSSKSGSYGLTLKKDLIKQSIVNMYELCDKIRKGEVTPTGLKLIKE